MRNDNDFLLLLADHLLFYKLALTWANRMKDKHFPSFVFALMIMAGALIIPAGIYYRVYLVTLTGFVIVCLFTVLLFMETND